MQKLVVPGGSFKDSDLFIDASGAHVVGSVIIAPVRRQSRPGISFLLAWDTQYIKDSKGPLETEEQSVFVSIARASGCKFASTPNGGFRSIQMANKMKLEGLSSGFPDLTMWGDKTGLLEVPTIPIEFKRRMGILSDFTRSQLKWLEHLHGRPSTVAVGAFGCQAALGVLEYKGYPVPARTRKRRKK